MGPLQCRPAQCGQHREGPVQPFEVKTASAENGKLQGKRLIFFPEGGVWYDENYKNGRLDGERFCFFPNGNKYCNEYYADGLLEGPRTVYAENGELLLNEEYHWGALVHNTERRSLP